MNKSTILTGEYIIAISFASWGAIKNGFWPWPPTLVKISTAFLVFGIISMAAPEIGAALAGGTLLALFLKEYQNGFPSYQGGVPNGNLQWPGVPLTWKKAS